MELDSRQTVIIAVIVLFLGRYLNQKIKFFQRYSIPEPVTGGVIASVAFSIIFVLFDFKIDFSLDQRDALLVIFFTCVGLSARFSTLLQGGKALLTLLVVAIVYLCIQNLTGIGSALITGLDIQSGILGGSVSLSGGHGTAIAWAPTFVDDFGISNAMEVGIACATFGLVLGGIAGGPLANYLVNRHTLEASSEEQISIGFSQEEEEKITVSSSYSVLLILCLAIGIGLYLHEVLAHTGLKLPLFVPCLFGGILLTNTVPYIFKNLNWPAGGPTLALLSDFSLGLFLAMSLMSLQLWTLIDLAIPILFLLIAQVIAVVAFTVFVIFPLLGKTYDAAVMSAGFVGLGLGATPTAIANMTAVTKKFGASPQAFIIIPLIGAFFIDIANAIVIQTFLNWFG